MPTFYRKPNFDFDPKKNRDKKPLLSARNVNYHIEEFLKTDATHMWMLDADCEAPSHALCELLKLDVDIASGVTFCHKRMWITTAGRWYPAPTPKEKWSKPYFKFFQIPEVFGKVIQSPVTVGTGAFCLLCKRRVFEEFHPQYNPVRFRWTPPQQFGIDLTFWWEAQMFGFSGAIHGGVIAGHLPEHPLKKLEKIDWIG